MIGKLYNGVNGARAAHSVVIHAGFGDYPCKPPMTMTATALEARAYSRAKSTAKKRTFPLGGELPEF